MTKKENLIESAHDMMTFTSHASDKGSGKTASGLLHQTLHILSSKYGCNLRLNHPKFEIIYYTVEKCLEEMQMEQQTVKTLIRLCHFEQVSFITAEEIRCVFDDI